MLNEINSRIVRKKDTGTILKSDLSNKLLSPRNEPSKNLVTFARVKKETPSSRNRGIRRKSNHLLAFSVDTSLNKIRRKSIMGTTLMGNLA